MAKHEATCDEQLKHGVALFNAADFFGAHEVWEDCWRTTAVRDKKAMQGLVQIAVGMHHNSTGNHIGAQSVLKRGLRNLDGAADDFCELDVLKLRRDVQHAIDEIERQAHVTGFEIRWKRSGGA